MLTRVLEVDEAVLLWLCNRQRPLFTSLFRLLTAIGNGSTLTVIGLGFVLYPTPFAHQIAWRFLLVAGGAALVGQGFKRLMKRARPNQRIKGFQSLTKNPDAFSFPSGHTASMTGLALSLFTVSSLLGCIASALAAGVALPRVYLGAHYPLDVVAGAVVGGAVALALNPLLMQL